MIFGIIVLLFGLALLLSNLGILSISTWGIFWPFLLIALGLGIIFGRKHCHCWGGCGKRGGHWKKQEEDMHKEFDENKSEENQQ